MKKCVLAFVLFILSITNYSIAQTKIWVPYLSFITDDNNFEKSVMIKDGSSIDAGSMPPHRFADAAEVVQYHFNIQDFAERYAKTPLHIRAYLWAEYVVTVSEDSIVSPNDGFIVAQYDPNALTNDAPDLTDGSNDTWIDIDIKDYLDLGWTHFYLSFFDGKPTTGHGPSVQTVGFYYEEDIANIQVNNINSAINNLGSLTIDGQLNDWPPATGWINIAKDGNGILTTGNVADNSDLSGIAGINFDKENVYIALDIKDNVISNGDSVFFYFGTYNLGDSLATSPGHIAGITDKDGNPISGYRNNYETDARFVVGINSTNPTIIESNIVGGVPESSEISIVKGTDNYFVEVKIPLKALSYFAPRYGEMYLVPTADEYYPFGFKIIDDDGSGNEGSLIAGNSEDVDINPNAWIFKTHTINLAQPFLENTLFDWHAKGSWGDTPGDDSFVVDDHGSDAGNHREAFGANYWAYHFNKQALLDSLQTLYGVAVPEKNAEFFFVPKLASQWLITAANTIGGAEDTVAVWNDGATDPDDFCANWSNEADNSFSLKEYFTNKGWSDVYLYIKDANPATTDCGAQIWWGRLEYRVKAKDTTGTLISWHAKGPWGDTPGDEPYVFEDHGSDAGNHREAFGENYWIYKFNVQAMQDTLSAHGLPRDLNLLFIPKIASQWLITVSNDPNGIQDTVAVWNEDTNNADDECVGWGNESDVSIDLAPYLDAEDIYITIRDAYPATTDCGAQTWWGRLDFEGYMPDQTTGVKRVDDNIPNSFVLHQNYPNPFNPETIISYSIPEQGIVILRIFNILGQEVKTLVSEVQSAGNYRITWKGDSNFGSKIASGIYLYSLNLNNKQQLVKKMVLLR